MDLKINDSVLEYDHQKELDTITSSMRDIVSKKLKRRGFIVAVSGGIDSSVSAALAVKALGKNKVFALLLPERDSADDTQDRGKMLVEHLGVEYIRHDIAPTLEAIGCYEWRDNAICEVFPEYTDGWKNKIAIAGGLEGKYNHFKLIVQNPQGVYFEKTLGLKQYLQIVAATNFKQRIRKTMEYFHADRLNYAVIGTPNRVEYDQGFFVKNGDGSADVKPIAHLYKTQVYSMARYLDLPEEICSAIPTTDTYSLPQGQDEFYYALPYEQMDIAIWAYNNDIPAKSLGEYLGFSTEKAEFVYQDIKAKRKTTQYMHLEPQLIEKVDLTID